MLDRLSFGGRRVVLALCLVLIAASVVGAVLGLYWSAEYSNCLATRGGFQDLLAGTCGGSP